MNSEKFLDTFVEILDATFHNDDSTSLHSKANQQLHFVNERGKDSINKYFGKLSEKNLALAVHVFIFYRLSYNHSIIEIKKKLLLRTYEQVERFNNIEFVNLYLLKQEFKAAKRTNCSIDKNKSDKFERQIEELHNLADVCFAALVLNDSDLMRRSFGISGKIIKDGISSDSFIDRFSEQINKADEINRGRLAVGFLSILYESINPVNSDYALRMLLHFKQMHSDSRTDSSQNHP